MRTDVGKARDEATVTWDAIVDTLCGLQRVILPFAALLIATVMVHAAVAQSYLTSTGSPNFSAPEPVELGFVDASNGNLHLSIPLGSYPQRGTSQPQAITLEYDSSFWVPEGGISFQWSPVNGPGNHSVPGWYYSYEASSTTYTQDATQGCWTDMSWSDQNGTLHVFHVNVNYYGTGCPSTGDAFATDSSGYHLYATSSDVEVYAPDGTLVFSDTMRDPQGRIYIGEDSNGNYMSLQATYSPDVFYDTLGRQVFTGGLAGNTATLATSQGTAQYSLSFATVNVNTNFQQSGIDEDSTTINVLRSVTLPDAAHSTYYFTYDCDEGSGNSACGSPSGQSAYYGELIGITLPTGGTVSYSYRTFKDAYGNMSEWVQNRSTAAGYWSYSPQVLSTCSADQVNCQQQTTASGPSGTTIYTFQLNNGAWPIQIVRKDDSGNVLSTMTNTWDFSQSCVMIDCHGASYVRLLNQQTTVPGPGGNLTKQVSYSYDSPQTGNKTAIQEWGYIPAGSSFPAVPDRATYMTYLTTGTNDINKPSSVTLCNRSGSDSACPGGGSRVSQTLYTYDNYTSGLTSISGVVQHDDQDFGSTYTTRGNVTEISRWVSGSNYLNTFYTYDTTGQILSETDPANNVAYYSYTDKFYTDPGDDIPPGAYTPQQSTNAYPTSVTDAIGTQTEAYYFGSGNEAVFTDYNGALTTYHYGDGLDRPTEEIDPLGTAIDPGGWKKAAYSSATQSDMYTAVGDTSPSTGCSSCRHTQTILDSLGRTSSQILVNSPVGQVNVDNTYNGERLDTQSHPYSGSGDPNHVFEKFAYDGLDRQTSVTHPDGQLSQMAYGPNVSMFGGGTAQVGSTSTYGYGYPQMSLDEAGKQHQEWRDAFGDIIEVDEPSTTGVQGTGSIALYDGQSGEVCDPTLAFCDYVNDYGTVYVTVFGQTFSTNYTVSDSGASALASELNASGLVTAVLSGDEMTLTAKAPGANAQITGYCVSNYPVPDGYITTFSCPTPSYSGISGGSGGISTSPLVTNYQYDAGGRLTQVIQGVQTRTFAYDGLGRKTYENTPEGGGVTYAYSMPGGSLCSGDPSNVCQRTDARGVVSTYTYNNADQLTGVAYSIPGGENISAMPNVCTTSNGSSANVCYFYGQGGAQAYALGRLTEMVDPTGSENYTYDAGERMTQLTKVISGQTYNIGYRYDAGGDVTQITYPSGRVVQQAYNAVGQLCQIAPTATGCSGSGYYAANFTYNAPGNLTGFTYGNGVTAVFSYSANRTQLSTLAYSKANSTYFSQQYWYQQESQNCPNGATGNNGSVQCITDLVDSGRTVSYGYDPLGRLISAKTNGSTAFPQWGMTESYDQFGNRWDQTATAGTVPQPQLTFGANGMGSSLSNQPNGYTFDASGNMIVEPLSPPNDMTYDGENRMTAFSGGGGAATYSYDGNGLRVIKSLTGGTTTVSIYSGSSVIAEYDNGAVPSLPSREYIYNPAGGATTGLLAMISGGTTTYYHQDDLSVRLTTDGSGNPLTQEGHFPFGELWYETGLTNKWFFTSYDRDSESGLDYALARYYDSRTGTFCSADPLAGDPSDPQSWNRYPYGRNDPIDITDPSGQAWWNWLIDIGVGITAALLPEMAPALFAGGGGGIWGSSTISLLDTSSTMYFATTTASTMSTSIGLGLSAGGMAVATSNPPQMPHMPTPQVKFTNCNHEYGTPNSKNNLTYQGFQDALTAAKSAGIQPNNLLALWDNENAVQESFPPVGPFGEVGPMQITTSGQNELSILGKGKMPTGWNTNAEANLYAGAKLFAHILKRHALSSAAARYNGGSHWQSGKAQNYQKNFNNKNALYQKLVNCMH